MFSATDHSYMTQALRLAEQGMYSTAPNPRVGAVIVREDAIVGEGWHAHAGDSHAEIIALQQAGTLAQGATVYVTLEPCSHFGRTPPCSDALIKAGVRRVVAAMQDPNPKVAGSGLDALRKQGIQVDCGLMEVQARELNIGFASRMERGRPWVRSKIASSLDGRTALADGVSQWITGESARRDVQHWRARSCAILTGAGTVQTDNPKLNVRAESGEPYGRQPLRVVVDSTLRTPPTAEILKGGALLVCGAMDDARAEALRDAGAEILLLPNAQKKVDLPALMAELARREINELHVEAGSQLNGALLEIGLIDELLLYMAPLLLGGGARGLFDYPILSDMAQRVQLSIQQLDRVGQDIRIRARIG